MASRRRQNLLEVFYSMRVLAVRLATVSTQGLCLVSKVRPTSNTWFWVRRSPGHVRLSRIAHHGRVMAHAVREGMLPLPAGLAVVFEALCVPAEVRPRLHADAAHAVLQKRINLDLLAELLRAQLDKGRTNCLGIAGGGAEHHPAGSDRILVLIWSHHEKNWKNSTKTQTLKLRLQDWSWERLFKYHQVL